MANFSPALATLVLLLSRLTKLQGCFHKISSDHGPVASIFRHEGSIIRISPPGGRTPAAPTTQPHHHFVEETDNAYTLTLEIPSVSTKDLDVSVDYNERRIVVICIPRRGRDVVAAATTTNGNDDAIGQEEEASHQFMFHVDSSVNLYDLTMAFNDGVIAVSVPKTVSLRTVKSKRNNKIRGTKRGAVVTGSLPHEGTALLLHHHKHQGTSSTATTGSSAGESIPLPKQTTMAAPRFTQIGAISNDFKDSNGHNNRVVRVSEY